MKELQLLSLALQRNGGVEISDRRSKTSLYRNCFIASELVDWIMQRFNTKRREAITICNMMRQSGFIYQVRDHSLPFVDRSDVFMEVKHPFKVKAALLPSQLEVRYRVLNSSSGPLVRDRQHGRKMYHFCVLGSEIVDWLVSVTDTTLRTTATAIGQQLMDAGYLFNLDHATEFEVLHYFVMLVGFVVCAVPEDVCVLIGLACSIVSVQRFIPRQS